MRKFEFLATMTERTNRRFSESISHFPWSIKIFPTTDTVTLQQESGISNVYILYYCVTNTSQSLKRLLGVCIEFGGLTIEEFHYLSCRQSPRGRLSKNKHHKHHYYS
jgi:hypothetical protein